MSQYVLQNVREWLGVGKLIGELLFATLISEGTQGRIVAQETLELCSNLMDS